LPAKMLAPMPEQAVRVATLIMERPMCASCIGSEFKKGGAEVEACLETIQRVLALRRAPSDCPECGLSTIVFSLPRATVAARITRRT
jgi:hypothetical protein